MYKIRFLFNDSSLQLKFSYICYMGRFDKALIRLKSRPKDFTWRELQQIMTHFGYEELKGSGSRRKFFNPDTKALISLHEPHPKPFLKAYALDLVIDHLKELSLL